MLKGLEDFMGEMDPEGYWEDLLIEELPYVLDVLDQWREEKCPEDVSNEHLKWIKRIYNEVDEF